SVNAEGRVCVQIGVLAVAAEPFTNGPLTGVEAIMSWLDSWGVSRRWRGGAPGGWAAVGGAAAGGAAAGGAAAGGAEGSRAAWARGGHFGASQVPGCAHVGPGAIDIHRLTGGPHGLGVRSRELPTPFAAAALPIPA